MDSPYTTVVFHKIYSSAAIGRLLKSLRLEQYDSQILFSINAGLDASYVSMIENGRYNISVAKLVELLIPLSMPLSQFFLQLESLATEQGLNLSMLCAEQTVDFYNFSERGGKTHGRIPHE